MSPSPSLAVSCSSSSRRTRHFAGVENDFVGRNSDLLERILGIEQGDVANSISHIGMERSQLVTSMASGLKRRLLGERVIKKSLSNSMTEKYIALVGEIEHFKVNELAEIPVIRPKSPRRRTHFELLQQWEGYVADIKDDYFTATLFDVTNPRGVADEEADFPIDEVSRSDMHLLEVGAVFRWVIGYRTRPSGKVRESQLIFRRMPQWREQDRPRIRKAAEEMEQAISWK